MSSATITTSARLMNSTPQTEEQAMVRKVAVSSFLGNFIEWFDYASYSYFATTIALVFFPTDNHTVAMLQTFGVFALSFILRPIGALFWGSYGDKKGRKAALAHSIMFMSGASFLIGCLPTFHDIGIWAPILLVLIRMIQGLSVSGEQAAAITMTLEHSPENRRSFTTSFVTSGSAAGGLLSTAIFIPFVALPQEQLMSWGWRVPFLFSAVMFFAPEFGGYFLEYNNFIPADPFQTPNHIAPVWYFTPFYSMLRAITSEMMYALIACVVLGAGYGVLKAKLPAIFKGGILVGAAVAVALMLAIDAKFWGVVVMGGAVIILFFLPWLDHSPVKSIRYRPDWHKYLYGVFVIIFLILGYLGVQPPSPIGERVSQVGTLFYFGFFLLMPWWSRIGETKPVPDRVTFVAH